VRRQGRALSSLLFNWRTRGRCRGAEPITPPARRPWLTTSEHSNMLQEAFRINAVFRASIHDADADQMMAAGQLRP